MNTYMQLLCIAATSLAVSAAARAQLHAGDFVLSVANNQIIISGSDGGSTFVPQRVFTNTFGAQGVDYFTTNPGFNSVPNQFPPSQLFGVSIEGTARRWANGNFCTVPAETITVYRSSTTFVSTDGGPQVAPPLPTPLFPVPHLTIGQSASGTGFFHTHPTYALNPDTLGNRADGVYLLKMRAWVGSPISPAVSTSAPFFLLLAQNVPPTDLDAARVWLESRLASNTPDADLLCPPTCLADFDQSGARSIDDIFIFLNAWFTGDPRCNVDGLSGVSIDDLFVFLNLWFAGCP